MDSVLIGNLCHSILPWHRCHHQLYRFLYLINQYFPKECILLGSKTVRNNLQLKKSFKTRKPENLLKRKEKYLTLPFQALSVRDKGVLCAWKWVLLLFYFFFQSLLTRGFLYSVMHLFHNFSFVLRFCLFWFGFVFAFRWSGQSSLDWPWSSDPPAFIPGCWNYRYGHQELVTCCWGLNPGFPTCQDTNLSYICGSVLYFLMLRENEIKILIHLNFQK